MRIYLDASVIVAVLMKDALNDHAGKLLGDLEFVAVLSDFALAEFASYTARRVRIDDLSEDDARSAFHRLDLWSRQNELITTTSVDVRDAEGLIRRLDLPLRTPDALNIALARPSGARLASFDRQMADAARRIGLEVLG